MTQLDAAVEFATNPEPRCACVLLLDVSASMARRPIEALNEGLRAFAADVKTDVLARQRVEVAIVTFGGHGVQVRQEFMIASEFEPPVLGASGGTPMGEAICKALEMVEDRKAQYRSNGISYYRPWVVLITDGAPTDAWTEAAERVRGAERSGAAAFFAVGVKGADMGVLGQIATRHPLSLDGLKFVELFVWLSRSQRRVSASKPGEETGLPAVEGWASV